MIMLQVAPYGIPVSALFYGHRPVERDYKDASKVKALDVHPVLPWVVTADEVRCSRADCDGC